MSVNFKPVIKWSGSKRSQCDEIIKHFPSHIKTYYEPFCGGASMMRHLLDNLDYIQVENIECSDLNQDLINLWNAIKTNPFEVAEHYRRLWTEMNSTDDISKKRDYFNNIRTRYNNEHNPYDFMFIMRTTTNGMPRYNSAGEFNNSFHITRPGIEPESLKDIILDWSNKLNKHNVQFIHRSYDDIKPVNGDLVYMDPPYANTKGMYFGNFDTERLFEFLKNLKCSWIMSYDGISGKEDNTYAVPKNLYDEHLYILSGNSSFKRTIGKSNDSIVYESLYIKNVEKPIGELNTESSLF